MIINARPWWRSVHDSKEAAAATQGLRQSLHPCRHQVETMTFDNSQEFARHAPLAQQLEAKRARLFSMLAGSATGAPSGGHLGFNCGMAALSGGNKKVSARHDRRRQ